MAGYSQITSGGQSGLVAGGIIQHTLFTEEFTAIVNSFNATTGHTHDGTAGEGGIITTLRSNPLTFGAVDTNDVVITFEGGSGNDGVLTWDQSADKFIFSDTVDIAGNLNVTGTADFAESNFTNVGTIALDSIKGDDDDDTSITFSGSNVITMKTNDTTRFAVNSTGVDVTGTITADGLTMLDSEKITLGTGGDLEIYHSGSHSIIEDTGTGNLLIKADDLILEDTNGNNFIKGVEGGTVQIWHNAASNADAKLTTAATGVDVNGTLTTDVVAGGSDTDTALTFAGSNQMVFKAGNVNQMTVGQGTGTSPTLQIAPAVETNTGDVGNGAIGLEMKNADLRMRVDGSFSSGTSIQNNSRLIFDLEDSKHIQHTSLGYKNPAFVIQANDNGSGGLNANISQVGTGDLAISAGILNLRSKTDNLDSGSSGDGGSSDDDTAGDGYFDHTSNMGISLSPDVTNGTNTRLHFGKGADYTKNVRLQPSASGILLDGRGTAASPQALQTSAADNSATIGLHNDEDLLSLSANAATVNGDLTLFNEDSDSNVNSSPTLTLQRKTSGANPQANDNLGQIIFKGEDGGGVDTDYIKLLTSIADATAGSEDAKFLIQGIKGGANKNIALFRSGLISFGQRNTADGSVRNENQPVEFNGPFYSRVGGSSGSRFVHSEQGLNLEGKYTVPIKNSRTIDTITNTSAGTACLVTTDADHGFSDNMLLYVDNTGISLLDGKSFFILTVTGQPKQLTLHNAYDGADPQHSGATASSGNIGGLGYGLRIHNTQTDSNHEQDCSIELGGNDDVFIDLKKTNAQDYDLRLAHLNNDTSYLTSKTGGLVLKTETTANVLIQHNSNTILSAQATGIVVTGTVTADALTMGDNEKITLGAGGDLEIYSDGTNGIIEEKSTSGNLVIKGKEVVIKDTADNRKIYAVDGSTGKVHLHYGDNATAKLTTESTGIAVIGKVTATVSAIGDNDVAVYGAGVADDDFLRINGTDVEGRSASEVLSDIGAQVKNTLVDRAGANVVEDEATSIGHDIVKTFVGKTFVYTGTADIILGLPAAGTDIAIGDQIHLVNASTTDGAELQIDLDDCGTNQPIRICTGSSVVTESTENPHIQDGGSVTLIAIGTNEYAMFGSGIENN